MAVSVGRTLYLQGRKIFFYREMDSFRKLTLCAAKASTIWISLTGVVPSMISNSIRPKVRVEGFHSHTLSVKLHCVHRQAC